MNGKKETVKIGEKFNHWTVLEFSHIDKSRRKYWICQCDCSDKNIKIVEDYALRYGRSKSCGCLRAVVCRSNFEKNAINIGDIYNNWKVIGDYINSPSGKRKWLCECLCDNKTVGYVFQDSLMDGTSKSCGCIRSKVSSEQNIFKKSSFEEWCKINNRKELLDRWDYELNCYSPNEVGIGSKRSFYFKCLEHPEHKSELHIIQGLQNGKNNITCRQCGSFGQWCKNNNRIDLLERWDYNLNSKSPFEISLGSSAKQYFKCPSGIHASEPKVLFNIIKGHEGSSSCKLCNSFAQVNINYLGCDFLDKYWDYDLNSISPWEISYASPSKKVWIICQNDKEHGSYLVSPGKFNDNRRCPKCGKSISKSRLHKKVDSYIKSLGYRIKNENECSILPICTDNNYPLPFDTEVPYLKLIIEVHGRQHYELLSSSSPWLRELNPREYLEKRLKYDAFKKDFAFKNGFCYLEIPYFTEKNNKYKELIDIKIESILNQTE